MKRTVGVERSYFISDYNIIKPMEVLTEIPSEFALNEEFINKVRFMQLINLELTFKKYLLFKEQVDKLSPIEAIEFLEGKRAELTDKLNQIVNEED